jgi:DNA-binding HxlR family transcriptional regulator
MKPIEKRPGCVQRTLQIIGDKWTARILLELSKSQATFSELEHALDSISPRTLSQRLDKLESEQIISKSQYCEHPPRYRYQITKKGSELHGVLRQMANWGAKYSIGESLNC